ncbi:SUMO-activating enzyme subunit 1 [Glugoides intestinalis]
MDTVKYDRQIRLLGFETQQKLYKMKIQVIGSANTVSAEIIKNVVLLGVGSVVITSKMLEEAKKLVPDALNAINESLKIEFSDSAVDCDFVFAVDIAIKGSTPSFFVCSKCLLLKAGDQQHTCEESDDCNLIAKHCLLGALVVQEYIKKTQGIKTLSFYRIEF